jgi:hypothetical protein
VHGKGPAGAALEPVRGSQQPERVTFGDAEPNTQPEPEPDAHAHGLPIPGHGAELGGAARELLRIGFAE